MTSGEIDLFILFYTSF